MIARALALILAAGLLLAAGARPALGQRALRVSGGLTLAQWRVQTTADTVEALRAAALGFEGNVALRRLELRIRYAQANLAPASSSPTTLNRRAAEDEVALGVKAFPWLRLATAAHGRSYTTTLIHQRWLMWELQAAGQFSLLGDAVQGYAEWRPILAAEVNVPESWNSGGGAEIGLRLAPPAIPVWMRLGYRLEIQKLGGGTRREVVDGLTVLLGVGTPGSRR